MQRNSFTEAQLLETIARFPTLISWCYEQFALRLDPEIRDRCARARCECCTRDALVVNVLSVIVAAACRSGLLSHKDAVAYLTKAARSGASEDDQSILSYFALFVHAVQVRGRPGASGHRCCTRDDDIRAPPALCLQKTNFYTRTPAALTFRIDPMCLSEAYPEKPFGILFVVGAEFR